MSVIIMATRDERIKKMKEKMKDIANSPRYIFENSNMTMEEYNKKYYGR